MPGSLHAHYTKATHSEPAHSRSTAHSKPTTRRYRNTQQSCLRPLGFVGSCHEWRREGQCSSERSGKWRQTLSAPREHQTRAVVVCCRRVGGVSVCCQLAGGVLVVHALEDYHEGGIVCFVVGESHVLVLPSSIEQ